MPTVSAHCRSQLLQLGSTSNGRVQCVWSATCVMRSSRDDDAADATADCQLVDLTTHIHPHHSRCSIVTLLYSVYSPPHIHHPHHSLTHSHCSIASTHHHTFIIHTTPLTLLYSAHYSPPLPLLHVHKFRRKKIKNANINVQKNLTV